MMMEKIMEKMENADLNVRSLIPKIPYVEMEKLIQVKSALPVLKMSKNVPPHVEMEQ